MSYYVRPMRKEDVPQINEIDREAFPTQWPPPNYRRELDNPLARHIVVCDESKTVEEPEVENPSEQSASSFVSRIRRWLRRDKIPPTEEYVIGFAGIWIMANEAHLTNIAVRNLHRCQGIGELLLLSIIDLVTQLKANIITLEVRVSNTAAQSLYTKYGFNRVGVRRGYYTDNKEDALLMTTESITSAPFQTRLQQLKQAHSRKYGANIVGNPTFLL